MTSRDARSPATLLALILALGAGACGNELSPIDGPDDTDSSNLLGQGEDCSGGGVCAEGLACSGIDGTCQQAGDPGTTPEDGPCTAGFDCQFGLVCAADGTCQQPGDPGTTGPGGDCDDSADCLLFLECLDGTCQGIVPPYWGGTTCGEPDPPEEPLRVYFEVDGDSGEFYRLPFPNDARVSGGKIDLAGHANPGLLVEELGDPVGDYFGIAENDLDGFGVQSCVYFRFNRWPGSGVFDLMNNMYVVDIDPDSEAYGEKAWVRFRADGARGKYICRNWLAICPSIGRTLREGTTYAAVVTTDVGGAAQDQDFTAMLAATAPSGPAMAHAWNAYAPFRSYLAEQGINGATIAAAAVFTTGLPTAHLPKVREAVRAEAVPVVTGLVADASDDAFTLYTGKVSVPFFQQGTRPFKTADDGGGIEYGSDGLPLWVEDEDVRFALTVPAGEAPLGGWPVVIFAHGTGGSELSFIGDGVAAPMGGAGAAVIGIEQVQHGDRRGLGADESDLESNSPERLVYNFLNARAARDNHVQAAADHFQLVRLIEEFAIVTGEPVVFDIDRVYFFGHSQGTQGPLLFASHEPAVKLLVLSGAGGYLVQSLLEKKRPLDVAAAIRLVLMEFGEVDTAHPLLNLIQAAFDPVDPAAHGSYPFRKDPELTGYPRRSVFVSYGLGDGYTPDSTQEALIRSLGVKQWAIDEEHAVSGVPLVEALPHGPTFNWGGGVAVTAVAVQYESDGDYDPHFVMFEHADAVWQYSEFVRSAIADGTPLLAEP
jgi:predicted esterase